MQTHPEPTQALLLGVQNALKRPVLLDPRAVETVLAAAVFHLQSGELPPAKAEKFTRMGSVAVVDIHGPLAQRAWDCMGLFGGDGYDAIVERMQAAFADPKTGGVLMRLDSPGGEVAGCFEAVRALRAMAQAAGKPLVAYADEMACSAAYALACAADTIVLPDTGAVGSIGVITTIVDRSAQVQASGNKVHVITSGARKADGHPALPVSEDTLAVIQDEIDYLAQVFAREVAASRGLTPEAVLALQAGVFLGEHAIAQHLADHVGGLDLALSIAANRTRPRRPMEPGYAAATARQSPGDSDVPDAQGHPVSADKPLDGAPAQVPGDETMKSLMIELGLAETASETEALKAVKALTTRAERAEQATQKLCSITGQADVGAAIGVAQAWKEDAARAATLDKEVAEMKAAKTAADVDAALDKAVKEMRVMPAEVPSLREQGLKDPGWLKGYLAVKTTVAQGGAFVQPGGDGTQKSRAKSWNEMAPQEKADLYHSDRATYEALKAAANAA